MGPTSPAADAIAALSENSGLSDDEVFAFLLHDGFHSIPPIECLTHDELQLIFRSGKVPKGQIAEHVADCASCLWEIRVLDRIRRSADPSVPRIKFEDIPEPRCLSASDITRFIDLGGTDAERMHLNHCSECSSLYHRHLARPDAYRTVAAVDQATAVAEREVGQPNDGFRHAKGA